MTPKPEVIYRRMVKAIDTLLDGECVTDADLLRLGFQPPEIAAYFQDALREALVNKRTDLWNQVVE